VPTERRDGARLSLTKNLQPKSKNTFLTTSLSFLPIKQALSLELVEGSMHVFAIGVGKPCHVRSFLWFRVSPKTSSKQISKNQNGELRFELDF
jgi:hypothetical protein